MGSAPASGSNDNLNKVLLPLLMRLLDAYRTSVDLVVPPLLQLLFILLDLDPEAASVLRRAVQDQIVVATVTAMSPYGSSTNTLRPSRRSLGIHTSPEY